MHHSLDLDGKEDLDALDIEQCIMNTALANCSIHQTGNNKNDNRMKFLLLIHCFDTMITLI